MRYDQVTVAKMNIILILIDNLRYDCVGYQPLKKELERYGVASMLKTPTLDSIAEKGICFTEAITTTPYTTPACASLLTGLYPPLHGVRVFWNQRMSPGIQTLPELLKQFGYKTVLYSDSIHFKDSNSGIDKGFDFYFVPATEKNFFDFLSEYKDQKLFILAHFFDIHGPFLYSESTIYPEYNNDYYQMMEKLYKGYKLETEWQAFREKPYDLFYYFLLEKAPNILSRDESYKLFISLYIEGINKFDNNRFRLFIKKLKDLGLYDNSGIFIFSDHGEGKSDKDNSFGHFGELYDSVIRIPLIIFYPDSSHRIVEQQVSIVDIFPTITEMVLGRNMEELLPYTLSGKSLLSESHKSSLAYSESWVPAQKGNMFSGPYYLLQRSIRTEKKKYIIQGKGEDINGKRFIIFDLLNDPLEENPIDPIKDITIMADFAKCLNTILEMETAGKEKIIENKCYSFTPDVQSSNSLMAIAGAAEDEALMRFLWHIRQRLIPRGTLRDRLFRLGIRGLRVWRREGFGAFLRKGMQKIKQRFFILPYPLKRLSKSSTIQLKTLQDKEELSMDIIKRAAEYFDMAAIAATFTAGKDTTVMLHLIKRAFNDIIPLKVFNIDTGFKFKEVYEFRDKLATLWNIPLIILRNESAFSPELINDPENCCYLLKTVPLKQAINGYGIKALMTAIRWDEQEERKEEGYFSQKEGHVRVHPILHFTEKDIWDYIKKYDLPYCSLYEKGYRSLGCEPCTKPSEPGGSERSGRDQDKERIMKRLRELGYF